MSKRSETRRWLDKHRNDPYVRAAQQDNYRSRAVYKLSEVNERDRLLKGKRCIVDLGAAPGGWSQYCRRQQPQARVVALDRLAMNPIDGVEFLHVDFDAQAGVDALLDTLGTDRVDLVLSDMAPNLTGIMVADQAGVMQLADLALALCTSVLEADGDLLIKVFQGEGFDQMLVDMRRRFRRVAVRKPKASRDGSREMYLLGRGWRI